MKRNVFARWLLDIGKYITTAMILSAALGAIERGWIYFVVCVAIAIVIVVGGFYIMDDKSKKNDNDV
jgi:hypothetical protein